MLGINNFLDTQDVPEKELLELLRIAKLFSEKPKNNLCSGDILALNFYEPSTRTYQSFMSAMYRLGGQVIGFCGVDATSILKGESIEDTARIMASYADLLVVRHPKVGSMASMAKHLPVPLINGGEGAGLHPTQTLTDLYTIYEHFGRLDVKIALYGDLKYGRTPHSLIKAASRFGATFYCVAPEQLQMPEKFLDIAEHNGADVEIVEDIQDVINQVDVLYLTRLQSERLPDDLDVLAFEDSYFVNQSTLNELRAEAVIMHPLPRNKELDPAIDGDPRAIYFQQAANGVPTRMALIATLLGKTIT